MGKNIWGRRPNGGLRNERSLFVWDMFKAHLVDWLKQRVTRGFKIDLAVIPGGLTSVLHSLDVSLNHLFQCRVRDQWTRWMSWGAAELTAAGNFKRPSLSTVATWVKTAWDFLEDCMIQKSFKKCSISNNGTTEQKCPWRNRRWHTLDRCSRRQPWYRWKDEDDTYDDLLVEKQAKKLLEDSSDEEDFLDFKQ